jgi:hypothetical protein
VSDPTDADVTPHTVSDRAAGPTVSDGPDDELTSGVGSPLGASLNRGPGC